MRSLAAFVFTLTIATVAYADDTPEHARAMAEYRQFIADAARLGSSCDDVAELVRLGGTVYTPEIVTDYYQEATRRKQAQIAGAKQSMASLGADQWTHEFFAKADQPDGSSAGQPAPKAHVAALRDIVQRAQCFDQDWATKVLATLDGIDAALDKMIATEKTCRATPLCMAGRTARDACTWIAQRKAIMTDIAREKANPAGVVNLVRLHDLGEQAQNASDQIAIDKARYAKLAGKAFTEVACKAE